VPLPESGSGGGRDGSRGGKNDTCEKQLEQDERVNGGVEWRGEGERNGKGGGYLHWRDIPAPSQYVSSSGHAWPGCNLRRGVTHDNRAL
jgi:hypothetical protein